MTLTLMLEFYSILKHLLLIKLFMTIEMLQNARNWAAKHQKLASGWGSAPDPAGGLPFPRPAEMTSPSQIPGYATVNNLIIITIIIIIIIIILSRRLPLASYGRGLLPQLLSGSKKLILKLLLTIIQHNL